MKIKEVRELPAGELAGSRRAMKQEILNLRIQQKNGQIENPARLRTLRKGIARIETVISEMTARHKEASAGKAVPAKAAPAKAKA